MAQQILNGVLTSLSTAISSSGQTIGISVYNLPQGYNNSSNVPTNYTFFNNTTGSLAEAGTFTNTSGSGPYTLIGVSRGLEGIPGIYPSGTNIGIGVATASVLYTYLPYESPNNKNIDNGYAGLDANGNLVGPLITYTDIASNLSTLVPMSGQQMYASDTFKLAVGNGSTTFSSLTPVTSATFGASGPSHSIGSVPDPGSASGTIRFLREDATWVNSFQQMTQPTSGIVIGGSTGIPGSAGIQLTDTLFDIRAGSGASTISGSNFNGGNGGVLPSTGAIIITAGNGSLPTSKVNGSNGGSIVGGIVIKAGSAGPVGTPSGNGSTGIGGSILGTAFIIQAGTGGKSSTNPNAPAVGGNGGNISGGVLITAGNGGAATTAISPTNSIANGGVGGSIVASSVIQIAAGNAGSGGSSNNAGGGNGGNITGIVIQAVAGSGVSGGTSLVGPAGSGGNVIAALIANAGNGGGNGSGATGALGGNGGSNGTINISGGSAGSGVSTTPGSNGSTGGSIILTGTAASGATAGVNGGIITLSGGTNTIVVTDSANSTFTITLPQFTGTSLVYQTTAPTASTSTGTKGMVASDATYLYVCTATNTWIRSALVGVW